ncbi:MAG: thioesterase family protein, partial [Fusobacteriaceae bacterium]
MFIFDYEIKPEDINEGKHVGNERALLFFQYARTAFLKQYGLSQLNLGDNIGLIQTNAYIEYLNQLFLGNEIAVKINNI